MANWFYYNASGEKVGPISSTALKALAQQGQITAETPVETETGQKSTAGKVAGLVFPEKAGEPKSEVIPAPIPPLVASDEVAYREPAKSSKKVSVFRTAGKAFRDWYRVSVIILLLAILCCVFPRHNKTRMVTERLVKTGAIYFLQQNSRLNNSNPVAHDLRAVYSEHDDLWIVSGYVRWTPSFFNEQEKRRDDLFMMRLRQYGNGDSWRLQYLEIDGDVAGDGQCRF